MNLFDRIAIYLGNSLEAASLKAAIVLIVAWIISLLMRHASGASRHLVWTLSVAAIIAAPLLEGILPTWRVAVLPAPTVVPASQIHSPNPVVKETYPSRSNQIVPESFTPQREPENVFESLPQATVQPMPLRAESQAPTVTKHPFIFWPMLIWAAGVIAIGVLGAVGAWMVRIAGRRASNVSSGSLNTMFEDLRRQLKIRRLVRLLIIDEAVMPIAWGIFRPCVLLPGEATHWPENQARSVLLHELAHVRRWDCATQLIALFACAIYWFNPLVWLAARRMRIERERACDDIVIGRGSSATAYAEYLVLLARNFRIRNTQDVIAVAMARRSGLADRVKAILNVNIKRREMNRRAKLISIIVVVVILLPLSAIHLMKKSAKSTSLLAAETAPQATTLPSSDDALPPLPAHFSSNQVAVQVLSAHGQPLRIDSILSIQVWIGPEMPWQDGPVPQVLARYAQDWILVDKEMFAAAHPSQRIAMTFTTGGSAITVVGKYPKSSNKIALQSLFDPAEVVADLSTGPAAAKDEVAGEVVDPGGNPVAGAIVSFPPLFSPRDKQTTTGNDGIFRFPDDRSFHPLYMQIQKAGYATRLLTDIPHGHGFLVHLDNHTRAKGQILGPDGVPASLAKLDFVTEKPTSRANMENPIPDLTFSTQADEQGQYDVPLEPGQYEVRITSPKNGFGRFNLQLASGQVHPVPGKLQAGVGLKITAIDTLTGKPAVGATFYLIQSGPGFQSQIPGSQRTTAADGIAQWDNLMPGPMQVDVQSGQFAPSNIYARWWTDEMGQERGGMRAIDSIPFNLSQGVSTVTVHMEPGMQVSGNVLSPAGDPVPNADVDIAGLRTGDSRYRRTTDANGNFTMLFPVFTQARGNFGPGDKYAIIAHDSLYRWANAIGEWFVPAVGQKLSVTLKMTLSARLRGRVVGSNGQPVAHLQVQGEADDRLDLAYYDPQTLTDDAGRFELSGMRAGNYSIHLSTELGFGPPSGELLGNLTVTADDRLDLGDLSYDGPPPGPLPNWYLRQKTSQSSKPIPQSDNTAWRHTTLSKPVAIQTPVAPMQPSPSPSQQVPDTLPQEEPLPGISAPAGHLSGKVVDAAGNPLAGVAIIVWLQDHGDKTDADGKFSLPNLPTDRAVEIRFKKEGYCPKFIPAQPAGLSGVVVVLTNKTYFEGEVKDQSGKPVAGAKIRADQGQKKADRSTISWVWTETSADAQGKYRLYVQADSYDIQVRMPGVGAARTGKIPIADGEAKHLDINLTSGITFRANVVDSITNQPVSDIRLFGNAYPDVEGRTDASGNLVIPFMEPGAISFRLDAKGFQRWWSSAAAKEWQRQPDIRNGNFQWNYITDLDLDITPGMPITPIVIERGVTIRGKVVDPDGHPVTGATIAAVDTGTDRSISGDERFAVSSKAGGAFVMTLPASGDHGYNLSAHDGSRRTWRKWANGVTPLIHIKPGEEMNDVTITLTRPSTVRGHVVDTDGNSIVGREVRAVASDLLEDINIEPSVKTDQNGNFELKYVRPTGQIIAVAPFMSLVPRMSDGTCINVTPTEGQMLEGVTLTAIAYDSGK